MILSKGTSLITNANCEYYGLFTKEGLNEVLVSDSLSGINDKINELKLSYTSEVTEELFPYPDRPIRVFIEHKQVTAMIETPYKPLIDFALLCPYIKDDSGITIWLKEFANEQFTAEEVQGVLTMFNAEITVK
jgi:hypothetical protein